MNTYLVTNKRFAAAIALILAVGTSTTAQAQHESPEEGLALHVVGDTLELTIPDPVAESLGVEWFKDDAPLADGGRISGATTRALQVSDLTLEDAGVYSAEYQGHAKHGLTYAVTVIIASEALVYSEGVPLSLTIPDPIEESLPISWYRNGEPLVPVDGIGGVGTRTLFIRELSHEDEGIYAAEYQGHAKHGHTFGPYYVKVVHNREVVMLGETLALDVPPPFVEPVEWFKDGVQLSDGGRVSGADTAALRISIAEAHDSGLYTASYAGHAKHHMTHNVRVHVVGEEVQLYPGETFTVTIPEPVEESLPITWFRDGLPVSNAGHTSGAGTATLTIDPVSTIDSGVYWAEYEEHAKHAATLPPVLLTVQNNNTPVPGMPVAGGAGLAALAAGVAGLGAYSQRRRK